MNSQGSDFKKNALIPLAASVKGSSLKSGHVTTSTNTSEKFCFKPEERTGNKLLNLIKTN
jgi:hypothetical protein